MIKRGLHNKHPQISEVTISVVEDHIKRFPAYQSHYSRNDCSKKYLSSSLSLSAMYRLYLDDCLAKEIEPVKEHFYHKIFNE